MRSPPMGRRALLRGAAIVGAALVPAPFVRGARAAGQLSIAAWDHPVPGANDALRRIVQAWADASRVEVRIDFITSMAAKDVLTARAEARARVGHDIVAHPGWQVAVHHRLLEPVDEIVQAVETAHGPYDEAASSMARIDGVWRGLPAPMGSHAHPMVSRLDLMRQHLELDLRQLFPADRGQRRAEAVESWSWEAFLAHAGRLRRADRPFAAPVGAGADAQNWLAPLFLAFGATLINARREVTVDSEQTRNALAYVVRLAEEMPAGRENWDDEESERWFVGDRSAVIVAAPSAWMAAGEGQPERAQQFWHHDLPRGPAGRYRAALPHFLGIWEFARNRAAARDLLRHLCGVDVVGRLVAASRGHDLPLHRAFRGLDTWGTVGLPRGTLYNYPVRGDEIVMAPGYPAPPREAALIHNQGLIGRMVSRALRAPDGIERAVVWARQELEAHLSG